MFPSGDNYLKAQKLSLYFNKPKLLLVTQESVFEPLAKHRVYLKMFLGIIFITAVDTHHSHHPPAFLGH